MLALGMAALAGAALIALWQARRLARPVDDLIAAADRLGDGDFTGTPAVSGIAEVDGAALALASTAGRLQELVTRERAFTAHASHQLRTPLTALRLSLENALLTPGVDIEAAVRSAVTETDRLQETVEQLFLLARGGGGAGGAGGASSDDSASAPAPALVRRSVPVDVVLRDLEQRWHPTLAAQGRRFEVRQEDAVAGRRTPATLGQVLDILVDNAVTHGRGRVEVVASAVPGSGDSGAGGSGGSGAGGSGGISIGVHDEGDGLAGRADRDRDGDGDGDRDGAHSGPNGTDANGAHGLGLGQAQSLVEAAGGRLVLSVSGPDREPGAAWRPVAAVILP
jgi:signal transduction histidine kinase